MHRCKLQLTIDYRAAVITTMATSQTHLHSMASDSRAKCGRSGAGARSRNLPFHSCRARLKERSSFGDIAVRQRLGKSVRTARICRILGQMIDQQSASGIGCLLLGSGAPPTNDCKWVGSCRFRSMGTNGRYTRTCSETCQSGRTYSVTAAFLAKRCRAEPLNDAILGLASRSALVGRML
jgi:hypothetical protein